MTEAELNEMRKLAESGASAQPEAEKEEGTDTPSEESQPESEVEQEEETQEEEAAPSEAENTEVAEAPRVPYSRFEKVNQRAIEAEKELEILKRQLAENPTRSTSEPHQGDLPDYWVELYGDSELSRKAWAAEQKRITAIEERAAESAVKNLQKVQQQEAARVEETVEEMENAFQDYGAKLKREFSDAEQSSILDIMDELTPKGEDGNYLVSPLTYLEKSVQFYDLQNQSVLSKKRAAKQKAAALTGGGSEGAPAESNPSSHFVGGNWDSWRNNPMLPKE